MILVVAKALNSGGKAWVLVFMWMVFEPWNSSKHCFIQSKPPHASNMNHHFSDIRHLCRAFCSWNDQFDLKGCLPTWFVNCLPRYSQNLGFPAQSYTILGWFHVVANEHVAFIICLTHKFATNGRKLVVYW